MEQITDVASLDPQATAQHAVPENREDVARIIETARTGWLTKYQVLYLLQHRGTLYLFDRSVNRYFRKDGHKWRKKGFGSTVRETHEKIKIAEKGVLNCYYAHSEEATGIMRRSYWLLDSDDTTVLVHYLEGQASRRLLTDENGAAIPKPSQRRRKAQKTASAQPPAEQPPAQPDAMQHVHMQQVEQPPPPSDTQTPPAPAPADIAQMPHVGQDIFDASLAHLVASGAYSTPEQLHSASMAHIAASQAAAMHRQVQLGGPSGHAPPHLDPALLSSLHAQQQQFFGLQPDMHARAMLMQQQQHHQLALFGTQAQGGKAEDVKPIMPMLQHASDSSNSLPAPPVASPEVAAAAAAARAGQFLQNPMTLHQQMQFMPFYGAMHPGFVVPPPGMGMPAPELPPPLLPDPGLVGALPHGPALAVPPPEAAAEAAPPPLSASDAGASGVPPPSAAQPHEPPSLATSGGAADSGAFGSARPGAGLQVAELPCVTGAPHCASTTDAMQPQGTAPVAVPQDPNTGAKESGEPLGTLVMPPVAQIQ